MRSVNPVNKPYGRLATTQTDSCRLFRRKADGRAERLNPVARDLFCSNSALRISPESRGAVLIIRPNNAMGRLTFSRWSDWEGKLHDLRKPFEACRALLLSASAGECESKNGSFIRATHCNVLSIPLNTRRALRCVAQRDDFQTTSARSEPGENKTAVP